MNFTIVNRFLRTLATATFLALLFCSLIPLMHAQEATSTKPSSSSAPAPQAPPADGQFDGPPGPPPDGQDGPPGPPPDGEMQGPPPGGPGGMRQSAYKLSGVFSAGTGEAKLERGGTYRSDAQDVSAIYAHDGGSISLTDAEVSTSGPTSSQENSSFFGLNAGVLAGAGGSISITGGNISTTGTGANDAFASGNGARLSLTNVNIRATAGGGHGVMVAGGGAMSLNNVSMETFGEHGAPIATDRGGGSITATGGTLISHGEGSPALYSTGQITVSNARMLAAGSEAAVIEGSNAITVSNSTLAGQKLWGVMLYQSFSGDAQGRQNQFTMTGGELSAAQGPLFYVTNTTGTIHLNGVKLNAASGVLVKSSAGRWGRKGSNGGTAILIADHQQLTGNLIVADSTSAIRATLTGHSHLTGAIHGASLSLEPGSRWTLTADSSLAALDGATLGKDGRITGIVGNGHNVTYNASDPHNSWLAGKRCPLAGGGELVPAN